MRIPVCEPFLNGNELEYVTDAVRSGWISSNGSYIARLETEFASYLGVKHGIGTLNGTVALHLALLACGIQQGDEVIIPDFTMIASAFAVCYCGAKPVFIDAVPNTWNINPEKIEEKITDRTRAIMVVHIYGHPVDMEAVLKIARRYDLTVLEDAAEAHGAEYKGRRCGSLSDAAAFSFYANKILTTGEGGIVVTDSDEIASKCRYFKNLCFPLDGPRSYIHQDIGYNYRMNNVQAAIGVAQLEKIDSYVEARRRNARLYNERLKDIDALQLPVEEEGVKNCYWMYGVILSEDKAISRDDLMKKLAEDGIDTRAFFYPMHRQPCLKKYGADCGGEFPVSDYLSSRGFYLPSASCLSVDQVDYICEKLVMWLKKC